MIINIWKKPDIVAIVSCSLIGIFLAILPHLSVFFQHGTFEYLADGDDVTHGLSSLSVYSDVIGTRLLLFFLILILFGLLLIGIILSIRLFTNLAIPGWATFTIGLLCLFILQNITISLLLIFIVLGSRSLYTILPCRDYQSYIIQSYNLYPEVSDG